MALGHWLKEYLSKIKSECNPGYTCKTVKRTAAKGKYTTAANEDGAIGTAVLFSNNINYDHFDVTFDGVKYLCSGTSDLMNNTYGAPITPAEDEGEPPVIDYSDYPFALTKPIGGDEGYLYTKTAGAHTLLVEHEDLVVTVSDCFVAAVKEAGKSSIDPIGSSDDGGLR